MLLGLITFIKHKVLYINIELVAKLYSLNSRKEKGNVEMVQLLLREDSLCYCKGGIGMNEFFCPCTPVIIIFQVESLPTVKPNYVQGAKCRLPKKIIEYKHVFCSFIQEKTNERLETKQNRQSLCLLSDSRFHCHLICARRVTNACIMCVVI